MQLTRNVIHCDNFFGHFNLFIVIVYYKSQFQNFQFEKLNDVSYQSCHDVNLIKVIQFIFKTLK